MADEELNIIAGLYIAITIMFVMALLNRDPIPVPLKEDLQIKECPAPSYVPSVRECWAKYVRDTYASE